MQNARLTEYVKWAYRVQDFQISGPAWLGQMQFDLYGQGRDASH